MVRDEIYYLSNSIARIFLVKFINAFIRIAVKSRLSEMYFAYCDKCINSLSQSAHSRSATSASYNGE